MFSLLTSWMSRPKSGTMRRFGSANNVDRRRSTVPVSLGVLELDSRIVPAATVQFNTGSETVAATAGTFSIPVTLSGAPSPTVTTFASGFTGPEGVAFDAAGNLYVADTFADTVDKVTPGGVVSTFASGITAPEALAFNAAGNLYVTGDGVLSVGAVYQVTPGGVISTFASGFAESAGNPPRGLAFDAAGNLYVADTFAGRVDKVTPGGVVSTFASGFPDPAGLAFDAAGNLYVADGTANRVDKVTPNGVVSTFTSGVNSPYGLAIDAGGDLYVTAYDPGSTGADLVDKVTPGGVVSTFASGFLNAAALAFDASGNLYAADSAAGTINQIGTAVPIPFTLGGTAVAGTDYSGVTTSPLVFAAGQTTATITGTLAPGSGGKTLTITLVPPTNATLGSPSTNTLTISAVPPPPPAAPTLTSISPASGPTAGGTTVTITGTDLGNATAVAFGGVAGAIVSDTATQIVATAPVESAGVVDVTVTTAGGTSVTSSADQFTYAIPPTVQFVAGSETTAAGSGTFRVQVSLSAPWTPTVATVASGFTNPSGLAFDTAGNLYMADASANTISKIVPGGTVTTFATGLAGPDGLAFDTAGNLFSDSPEVTQVGLEQPGLDSGG
ncbi:IPT/TIG domain-containing protein [Fimbriiglobus ruber]|uniref:Flagellar hook-length control protein FliK n=1 Tax=Fimbriiglobus ruber TaxID=1908690 RepID=A0A225DRW9_9BACT|nr:IPT/TIG domain-containing protein [Fimbriiglobus ruber]OWK39899.1 Flagellar hook-length control protein FliK [Fimbriiglobus ruber]